MLRRRTVGVLGLAVCAAILPSLGPNRFFIAGGLFLVGPIYHFAMRSTYRRSGRIPGWMAYTDVALAVTFPLIAPTTFTPALLVLVSIVSLSAAMIGTRPAVLSIGLAVIGTTLGAAVWSPPQATLQITIMAVTALVGALTVGPFATNALHMQARFTSLVEGIEGIVWEADSTTGEMTYVSPQVEAILGYPASQINEHGFWAACTLTEDRDRLDGVRAEAKAGGTGYEVQYRALHAQGHMVHLHETATITPGTIDGQPPTTHGITIDVTDREETLQTVRRYGDLVESINLGLLVAHLPDRDDPLSFTLVAANPVASTAVGRSLDEAGGQRIVDLLPNTEVLLAHAAEVLRTGNTFHLDSYVARPDQETEMVLALRVFPLSGEAVGVSLQDVTAEARASEELQRQALHDGLTDLPNRNHLRTRLGQALDTAENEGSSAALLVMDLDQFKEVNDALGHHVGDLLLHELGQRLQSLIRSGDMVARLGGDEFAVLMTGDVTEKSAVAMAKRIRSALLQPFTLGELQIQTNASIGIAIYPDHGDDADGLNQRADVAMYQSKRAGTGWSVYKAEHDRSSLRRLTLLSELHRALEEHEFVLHYQPIISVGDGRPVKAEALVRWEHPLHGVIGPDDFIELAEVSGLIQPLTHWIVAEAIQCADGWWRDGHRVGVAINLSVRNLYDPGLPAYVSELLSHSILPPDRLTFEVTENELMDDPGSAMDVLGQLRRLRVTASIDDFGTGYSSLSYLRNLRVAEMKIDRSFVAALATDPDDLAIVRSTIELGHNLGLTVVAEGVEDAESLSQLGELGCDLAQGFHIARPLPIAGFREWLDREHPATITPSTQALSEPLDATKPRHLLSNLR